MISNQVLQNTIEGIKSISRVDLYVADTDGKIIASTSQAGDQFSSAIMAFVASPADSQSVQEYQFFKVYDENQLELILIAQVTSDDVFMVGKMVQVICGLVIENKQLLLILINHKEMANILQ